MASDDRATEAQYQDYLIKRAKIMVSVQDWDMPSKGYLSEVLDELEMVMILYQNGDGDLNVDGRSWNQILDQKVIIPKINKHLKSELNLTVSASEIGGSLERLWFSTCWESES